MLVRIRNPIRAALGLALALVPAAALAGTADIGTGVDVGRGDIGPIREVIDQGMYWISTGIEVTGVGIIVIGAFAATLLFVYTGLVTVGWPGAFRTYRANLGRGILLGLELLVAADIIGTVAVAPSFESLFVLGLIVLIRTFLSFSLEVEIEGRWPWQRHGEASSDRDAKEGRQV